MDGITVLAALPVGKAAGSPVVSLADAEGVLAAGETCGVADIPALVGVVLEARRKAAGWGRVRLRALRQLGDFLTRCAAPPGRPKKDRCGDVFPTLAELGVDKDTGADAKLVSRIAQKDFDDYLAHVDEPTLVGLLRAASVDPGGRVRAAVAAVTHRSYEYLFDRGSAPAPAARRIVPMRITGNAIGLQCTQSHSVEYYTPLSVFKMFGDIEFDMDVASPGRDVTPWIPAKRFITRAEDGLKVPWRGFVWCNPPYGIAHGVEDWVDRFVQHGNGVALIADWTSTGWWQTLCRGSEFILHANRKIPFIRNPPIEKSTNTLGSTFFSIGERGINALKQAERNGLGVLVRRP